jgi:MFS family permease
VVFAGGLAAGAHIGKVPPALPAIRADLGLSLLQSGFVATMLYAIGALVGVFGGAVADRYGQKRFALIGLATMSIGGLIGAVAQGYLPLLASRFLEGIGFILFTVAAAPLLAAATRPEDRATAFSVWSAYMPTGGSRCSPHRSRWRASAGAACGWGSRPAPPGARFSSRARFPPPRLAEASARSGC